LGAKRPQDFAWQFVVAALVGVLWLPAGQWWLARGGTRLELHAAWSWFLAALVLLGLANHLATRFWLPALLAATGQWMLLAPQLPLLACPLSDAARAIVGLALVVAALVAAVRTASRRRNSLTPLDRVWLDFRDAFGAAWALRVQQRIHASAAAYGWNLTLHWSGFATRDGAATHSIPPDDAAAALAGLNGLLRRFVSPEWIAERAGGLSAKSRQEPK
jgi:hypothetical protein